MDNDQGEFHQSSIIHQNVVINVCSEDSLSSSLLLHNIPLSSTPLISAGLEISRGKYGGFGFGTAGLIVRKKGASTGAFVLTCAHVLGLFTIGEPEKVANDNLVYQPKLKECCDIECNKPFGKVVVETLPTDRTKEVQEITLGGDEIFAVDAALIELASETNAYNLIKEIGTIKGTRDLVKEWSLQSKQQVLELPVAKQIVVRKFGATTGFTRGKILRLVRYLPEGQSISTESTPLLFEIEVDPAQTPFTAEYELDMERFKARFEIETVEEITEQFKDTKTTATIGGSSKTPTLKIEGHTFSQPGDSGAPIVDEANNIVGLLRSGSFVTIFVKGREEPVEIATGNTQGIFIGAAFEKLNVLLLPEGQHTSGDRIVVPGMAIESHS